MSVCRLLTAEELEAGLDKIRQSPRDEGVLALIVRRPSADARDVLEVGELSPVEGLIGDAWSARQASQASDATRTKTQLTVMNSRAIALIAQDRSRWPLAGDQLYLDLDLSSSNLPPGTQLAIGSALVEVTDQPHTGCRKFSARFGSEALKFVNSAAGRQLNLRGIYVRVIQGGRVQVGDQARKHFAQATHGPSPETLPT